MLLYLQNIIDDISFEKNVIASPFYDEK